MRTETEMQRTAKSILYRILALSLLSILAGMSLFACAHGTMVKIPDETEMLGFPEVNPNDPVRLQAGDDIQINVQYWPDLDDTQKVRRDGMITPRLIGDVMAEGLTPAELDSKLTELYAAKIKDPDITIIMRGQVNNRVFVGGEVNGGGIIEMPGRMTLVEAIWAAGGYNTQSARPQKVVVMREKDGRWYGKVFDLAEVVTEDQGGSFYLAPRDVVFVSRTRIDRLNQFVNQYINSALPAGMTAAKDIGGNTVIGYSIGN
jgi:polysaccharide export outer membrane protein